MHVVRVVGTIEPIQGLIMSPEPGVHERQSRRAVHTVRAKRLRVCSGLQEPLRRAPACRTSSRGARSLCYFPPLNCPAFCNASKANSLLPNCSHACASW